MPDENAKTCGIVMPISAMEGCAESHWSDVLEILTEAIESAGFEANLVSNADDVGIIHKRIIQNLYDNPIVVCDVSGKNPNVMFELGLRLAFDKPTIIVKDTQTTYSFDTAAIEHLEYPRDLRFSKIVEFKQKLKDKIEATYRKATSDPNYTTFLKHFGEFKVAKLDQREVSGQEYLLEEMRNLRHSMRRLEQVQLGNESNRDSVRQRRPRVEESIDICMGDWPKAQIDAAHKLALSHPNVENVSLVTRGEGHSHLLVQFTRGSSRAEIHELECRLDSMQPAELKRRHPANTGRKITSSDSVVS